MTFGIQTLHIIRYARSIMLCHTVKQALQITGDVYKRQVHARARARVHARVHGHDDVHARAHARVHSHDHVHAHDYALLHRRCHAKRPYHDHD